MESIKGGKKDPTYERLMEVVINLLEKLGNKFDHYLTALLAERSEDRMERFNDRKDRELALKRYNKLAEIRCQIEEERLNNILRSLKAEPAGEVLKVGGPVENLRDIHRHVEIDQKRAGVDSRGVVDGFRTYSPVDADFEEVK